MGRQKQSMYLTISMLYASIAAPRPLPRFPSAYDQMIMYWRTLTQGVP